MVGIPVQFGSRSRSRSEAVAVIADVGELTVKTESVEGIQVSQFIVGFIRDEQGQDLIEYTLLLAFVCLASAALFIGAGSTLAGIWSTTNLILVNANSIAVSAQS